MSTQVLIVCGPTAVGKTSFGLELARQFSGEIISADSRQVYTGLDIVTGKDLPLGLPPQVSSLKWRDRFLKYYVLKGQRIWLYDVVTPVEPFNVSFWKECADLVITDIHSRGHLPIIVGGTGLYIKSIISNLSSISIPPNAGLRQKLLSRSPLSLFNYLKRIDSLRAAQLNKSDRHNPRRLIRAIEIALSPLPSVSPSVGYQTLSLGLTAPLPVLFYRVDARIRTRLHTGAAAEAASLASTYGTDLPALTACGYPALFSPDPFASWSKAEHGYLRRQLTWFKAQPSITWFDITVPNWSASAAGVVAKWYNLTI